MKYTNIFLITSCLFFSSSGLTAATVTGLYEAELSVDDQSPRHRNLAFRSALIQVLVKLTGNRNIDEIYGISNLLERSSQYVQQYKYRTERDRKATADITKFWVNFDAKAIDKDMREYNIPVWGQERPSTLVWLVVEDNLGSRFANLDQDEDYFSMLQEQARLRGVSFIVPLYDLQDAATITFGDVSGRFQAPILAASKRYQPDAILVGSLVEGGPSLWEGRWMSIIQKKVFKWINSGNAVEIILDEGMNRHVDHLAAQFAESQGPAGDHNRQIRVSGIRNFSDYTRVLSYLESLNFISSVDVQSMDSDQVVYVLSARGDSDKLVQALALGRVLQPSENHGEYQFLRQ